MKTKLLQIGNDFLNVDNILRISRTTRRDITIIHNAEDEEGVSIKHQNGEIVSYYGPGLWPAVLAWIDSECDFVPITGAPTEIRGSR